MNNQFSNEISAQIILIETQDQHQPIHRVRGSAIYPTYINVRVGQRVTLGRPLMIETIETMNDN